MPDKPDRSFFWLGKYLSLALTLPASVVAGYLVGAFFDHRFHMPILRVIGIILGMAGGMIQVFREVSRDEKRK